MSVLTSVRCAMFRHDPILLSTYLNDSA